MNDVSAASVSPGYGPGALARHLISSVTRMRRVTREMVDAPLDEGWRLICFLLVGVAFAVETAVLQAYAPDAEITTWIETVGGVVPFYLLGVVLVGVVFPYLLATLNWLAFRLFRRPAAFADVRTGIAASGFPIVLTSLILSALAGGSILLGQAPNAGVDSAIAVVDAVIMFLSIGYSVVAVSAATGVSTLQTLGIQALGGIVAIVAAAAIAWMVGIVI